MAPRVSSCLRAGLPDRHEWPGTLIVVNDHPSIPLVVTIGCWNEWTERHYLLPDTRHGFGMLAALWRALKQTAVRQNLWISLGMVCIDNLWLVCYTMFRPKV